jgi:parallel beta-helix repeat protein
MQTKRFGTGRQWHLACIRHHCPKLTVGAGGTRTMVRALCLTGAAVLVAIALTHSTTLEAALSCSAATVRCVDDTAGANQEYSTIQAAVTAAQPGDTVLVFDGTYQGFQVTKSGTASAPIVIMAQGAAAIISTPTSTSDGVFLSDVSYVTIQDFQIQNMPQRCISARNATPTEPVYGLTIRGNTCTNAGHEGFYLSEVSHSLIEGNTITGSGSDGQTRGHGMYLANAGSDNTIIRGNRISGMKTDDSAGIHFNGDLSVGGDGIISGLLVEQNVISGGRQNGFNMDGVQDSTFQNNLVYGVSNNALRGYAIDGAAGPKNMRVINNTLIGGGGWAVKFTEESGGHVVFNNVLLGGGAICVPNASLVSDYNVAIDRFSRDNDSSAISLTAWRAFGNDTHSLVSAAASLFVNPGANDYHLKSGAPAIDAGTRSFGSLAAPSIDLDSLLRPAGTTDDAGAYEAGGTTAAAPRAPTNVRIVKL